LAEFHGFTNWGQKQATIGIQFFAGILGKQLIDLSSKIPRKHKFVPSVSSDSQLFSPSTVQVTESTNISSITDQDNAVIVIPERTLTDVNGVKHHQVVYPLGQQSSGKKCTKTRACKICKSNGQRRLVRYYCYTCGLSAAYCVDFKRDCFHKHVSIITRSM
jgi:hypothetical protein